MPAKAAPSGAGLFDVPGASAALAAADATAEVRNLADAMRRAHIRAENFQAAALSEPQTAAALQPLTDQGWQVLHDRRWPGSTRSNVDHLAVGPGGVAVIDTKHWSEPVQVRDGRLWCGDDDRHDDAVDGILRLTEAVEDLLLEVATSDPGRAVGLSPIHVVPVLVFTKHPRANTLAPQVGRVLLCTLSHLPVRLARRKYLSPVQVALIGEYLAREMPPALERVTPAGPATRVVPAQRVVGVPNRPRPAPPVAPPPPEEPMFDPVELAEQIVAAAAQPIQEWMGFLHPAQARLVRRVFNGPARVRGPAGTGKTVVLLHRAAWLATIRTGRVLVTSFVHTLPRQLEAPYRRLSPDTVDRVDFVGIHALARDVLERNGQRFPVYYERVDRAFRKAWERAGRETVLARLAPDRYWREEIDRVIKGRGLRELAEYEAVDRRGRELPLTDNHKHTVWTLLHAYQNELDRARTYDSNDVLSAALDAVRRGAVDSRWSAVLVDEVQDLSLLGLRLCHELAGDGVDALFLVGDGQQALYPGGFTLADAGISVTGRAVVLRTNYRNTRSILDSARALVAHRDFTDLDAGTEPGQQEVDVLRDGPAVVEATAPTIHGLTLMLHLALRRAAESGARWGEMAVLCHTNHHAAGVRARLDRLGVPVEALEEWRGGPDANVKIGTIHRSKGLDFAAVFLLDLDGPRAVDDSGPDVMSDEWELGWTQREYVGRTRARDRLWLGRLQLPVC